MVARRAREPSRSANGRNARLLPCPRRLPRLNKIRSLPSLADPVDRPLTVNCRRRKLIPLYHDRSERPRRTVSRRRETATCAADRQPAFFPRKSWDLVGSNQAQRLLDSLVMTIEVGTSLQRPRIVHPGGEV